MINVKLEKRMAQIFQEDPEYYTCMDPGKFRLEVEALMALEEQMAEDENFVRKTEGYV